MDVPWKAVYIEQKTQVYSISCLGIVNEKIVDWTINGDTCVIYLIFGGSSVCLNFCYKNDFCQNV